MTVGLYEFKDITSTLGNNKMTIEGYDNIDEIAEAIYSRPPAPPNSVQLELEDETADIAQREGIAEFVFHILYLITFKGIEMLYGHKNIQNLTD